MAKNEAVTVIYTAWDTAGNAPKTGDVANHTIRYIADGVAATPAASPVEVERGEYKLVIAAGENTGTMMAVIGVSSTANVVIVKASWQNADRNAIADAILSRNVSNVEAAIKAADDEHTLATVILAILESAISGTTWTIKQTDGATTQFSKTVTVDEDANPITGVG